MRYILFILMAAFAISAIAGVYYVNQNGTALFTDIPPGANSQVLTPAQINSNSIIAPSQQPQMPGPGNRAHPAQNAAMGGGNGHVPYTSFIMVSPQNGDTIQNQPVIPVEVSVTPQLQPGDTVEILLDGTSWGGPAPTTQFSLTRPDRGTHTVSARLLDANKNILDSTAPVTVYIHQAHLGGTTT